MSIVLRVYDPSFCNMWAGCHLTRTHRFDIVTKQDVPQVSGTLVPLHVQLALRTHRPVSFASAGSDNLGD
jgi:hypothetical protein